MDFISHYVSPLGPITLSSDGEALTGLWFDGQKYFGATLPEHREEQDCPVFRDAFRWLDLYFEGRAPGFPPPWPPGAVNTDKRCGRPCWRSPTAKPSLTPGLPGSSPPPPGRWPAP